jgi:hypothetical protein
MNLYLALDSMATITGARHLKLGMEIGYIVTCVCVAGGGVRVMKIMVSSSDD